MQRDSNFLEAHYWFTAWVGNELLTMRSISSSTNFWVKLLSSSTLLTWVISQIQWFRVQDTHIFLYKLRARDPDKCAVCVVCHSSGQQCLPSPWWTIQKNTLQTSEAIRVSIHWYPYKCWEWVTAGTEAYGLAQHQMYQSRPLASEL